MNIFNINYNIKSIPTSYKLKIEPFGLNNLKLLDVVGNCFKIPEINKILCQNCNIFKIITVKNFNQLLFVIKIFLKRIY